MMSFVHELQVYNNVEKISFNCGLVVGHRTKDVLSTK